MALDLVLEFVRGGDLLDYILKREGLRKRNSNSSARERSLSPGDIAEEETKNITYQICDALAVCTFSLYQCMVLIFDFSLLSTSIVQESPTVT